MSKMVDKLVRDDCVERIAQEGDRRVNLIRITKKGSDLLDAIWPHYKEKINKIVGSAFSKSEKKELVRILEKFKNIT
jgi:DNA-binding MarR family transcriptional regulator